MNKLSKRWVADRVAKAMKVMPVVVITGARQAGKTTLARMLFPDRKYLSLDRLDVLEQAQKDPLSLIQNAPMTLDEVQHAPSILKAIKQRVDDDRKPGLFLLTGSAQLPLLRHVSESLAGRAFYLDLSPFCPAEWRGDDRMADMIGDINDGTPDVKDWEGSPDSNWTSDLLYGGYPPVFAAKDSDERDIWFAGYLQTYLERDLRDLSAVSSLPDFQRLMRLSAQRTSRLLNISELARDAHISQPTASRYMNLLETGCQIMRLRCYASNASKTYMKSAKLMFTDSGLAAWLAGIRNSSELMRRSDAGFWLEQAIYQTLHSWQSLDPVSRQIFYWRERDKAEVDFVLSEGDQLACVEVKSGQMVRPDDLNGILRFRQAMKLSPKKCPAVVFYAGSTARVVADHISALPFHRLFSKRER
ncbi:MAG: ATP-binding protein [Kiritimatiellia bacterium]